MSLLATLHLRGLVAGHAQGETEDRPALRRGLHPDLAAMGLDYGATDRQAEPHPFLFGGDKRLEEMRLDVWRKAPAGVRDAHLDRTVALQHRLDRELAAPRRLHQDFDCVA